MTYQIPADLAQAILNYLVEQRYRDVYQMVQGLQALQPVEPVESGDAPES